MIFFYLLLSAPKLLWDRLVRGKRHPGFLQRLGWIKVARPIRPVIWVHAVSVGEVKAVQSLYSELRKKNANSYFLITTTTATGNAEAKRSLKDADFYGYLPIDFSWSMRRFIRHFEPKQFILVESDFWPNLLKELKKQKTQIFLVNGKISERSFRRFRLFLPFSKKLFSYFDRICVQNEEHQKRFLELAADPSKVLITGNLKFDLEKQKVKVQFQLPKPVITLSCTHFPEEELLLDALLGGDWFLVLAPRHPERFKEAAQILLKKKIPFSKWSEKRVEGKVLLVDEMGQLPIFYSQSDLTILGGSFVEHVGGHNVLEPCLYGSPVFFGPNMFGQRELAGLALKAGVGKQVENSRLRSEVQEFFDLPTQQSQMRAASRNLIQSIHGSTKKTLTALELQ